MLSFVVTAACFLAAINKVNSQKIYNNLSLILVNETSPQCYFNNSNYNISNLNNSYNKNESAIYMCLDDNYNYECTHNQTNSNITLECQLKNKTNTCHSSFISYNGYNITLDCFYRQINTTVIGNQFNLKYVNECMYGIASANHNNTLLVCAIHHPLITVTTFNNTQIFQQNAKYYKFPLFGFEVNKHLVKKYGILIIIAIIVVSCLVACCLFGMCHMCCLHKKNKDKNNSNNNQRMPQSANSYDI